MPGVNPDVINLLNKAYKDSSSGGSLRSLNWNRKDTKGDFSRSRKASGKKSKSYKKQTPDLKNPQTKKRNGRGNSGKGRNLKSATRNSPPPSQNISKFGGGVKGNNAVTFKGIAASAKSAGRATAPLHKVIGSGLLQSVKANPVLALTVGNFIVWKKNIETLKGIYGYKNIPPMLTFPTTSALIAGAVNASFTGGRSPGVNYTVSIYVDRYFTSGQLIQSLHRYGPYTSFGVINNIYLDYRVNDTRPGLMATYVMIDAHNNLGAKVLSSYFVEGNGFEAKVVRIEVIRADGQPDTGGNLPPIANAVYSTGGVSTGYLPTQPSEAKPKPIISPETESEKLTKPLAIPATSPNTEPVPDVIPEVEPLPGEERDISPSSPTEAPPIKKEDTTNPAVKKKPAASTKTTYYPEELPGDVKRAIEESKERQPGTIKVIKGYSPAPVPGKAVEVVPGVSSPSTEPVPEAEGQTTPTLPPVPVFRPAPTTTIKNPPAPAPTVTPVNGCKKGCGSGGGLSQTDSDNLANTNSLLQLLDIGLLKKIDATTTVTKNTVTHITYGLEAVQTFADKAWKATQADKVLQVLNTTLLIHNGMMLSNNLLQTLGEATNMALDAIGIKDHNQQAIDVNTLVKGKINAVLSSVLGASNYAALTARIAKANRIYQASANVLSNIRSIIDSTQDIAETTGENVSVIGNALKKSGVVRENAYNWMPENLNNTSRVLNKLEKISNGADAISDITSEAQSISEDIKDMKTSRDDFKKEFTKTTEAKTKTEKLEKVSATSSPEPIEEDEVRGVDGKNK